MPTVDLVAAVCGLLKLAQTHMGYGSYTEFVCVLVSALWLLMYSRMEMPPGVHHPHYALAGFRPIPDDLGSVLLCTTMLPAATMLSCMLAQQVQPYHDDPYLWIVFLFSIWQGILALVSAFSLVSAHNILQMPKDLTYTLRYATGIRRQSEQSISPGQQFPWRPSEICIPLFIYMVICMMYQGVGCMWVAVVAICLCAQLWICHRLPLWLPLSFTISEALLVSQAAAAVLLSTICNILHKFEIDFVNSPMIEYWQGANYFMQVSLLCCIVMLWLLYRLSWLRHPVLYYVTFMVMTGGVALGMLWVLLGQDYVTWTYRFLTQSRMRVKLFMYWVACSVTAAIIVMWNSGSIPETMDLIQNKIKDWTSNIHGPHQDLTKDPDIKSEPNSRDMYSEKGNLKSEKFSDEDGLHTEILNSVMDGEDVCPGGERGAAEVCGVSTRTRKYFHILAVGIFVPGLVLDPLCLCVAATCGLVVFIMLESVRLLHIPPVGAEVERNFQIFVDSKDQGRVILTHLYLLAGCTTPLWLYPLPLGPHLCLYAGVISLGVGDTMASVVGSLYGAHKWPGSSKSVEGTVAAVISQVLAVWVLHYTGMVVMVEWWKVWVAVLLTSLLEAFTLQIDNLILPLFMYICLI